MSQAASKPHTFTLASPLLGHRLGRGCGLPSVPRPRALMANQKLVALLARNQRRRASRQRPLRGAQWIVATSLEPVLHWL